MQGKLKGLLSDLKSRFEEMYAERLFGIYLFGSHARGEANGESDVDVLIVLHDFTGYGAEVDASSELVASLSLKYSVSISTVFVRLRDWLQGDSAFLINVREDAVAA
jgi:predicted nucleotidyltransferase